MNKRFLQLNLGKTHRNAIYRAQ